MDTTQTIQATLIVALDLQIPVQTIVRQAKEMGAVNGKKITYSYLGSGISKTSTLKEFRKDYESKRYGAIIDLNVTLEIGTTPQKVRAQFFGRVIRYNDGNIIVMVSEILYPNANPVHGVRYKKPLQIVVHKYKVQSIY